MFPSGKPPAASPAAAPQRGAAQSELGRSEMLQASEEQGASACSQMYNSTGITLRPSAST